MIGSEYPGLTLQRKVTPNGSNRFNHTARPSSQYYFRYATM